ncbi:hypothetical protein H1R20_g9551, partial [Candolleomyces eurysporus]
MHARLPAINEGALPTSDSPAILLVLLVLFFLDDNINIPISPTIFHHPIHIHTLIIARRTFAAPTNSPPTRTIRHGPTPRPSSKHLRRLTGTAPAPNRAPRQRPASTGYDTRPMIRARNPIAIWVPDQPSSLRRPPTLRRSNRPMIAIVASAVRAHTPKRIVIMPPAIRNGNRLRGVRIRHRCTIVGIARG